MQVHEAASRLLACPRLSREREAERQRVIHQPLHVPWKETVEDGQVYISISSDESDGESCEDAPSPPSPLERVKTETRSPGPDIFTIESSDEEEEEDDAAPVDDMRQEQEEKEEEAEQEEEYEQEYEQEQEYEYESEEYEEQQDEPVQQEGPIVWEQQQNGVRKRRLGEEDAAFLLFYGERESPSADILRLIVELIECGVGASDLFLSRFIKYMLWCKLNSAVEASLVGERAVQSEWSKIVFSCPVPRHRHRSGPMPRPDLLPRPITITVRPLQLARKQPRRRSLSIGTGNAATHESLARKEPPSPRATAEEKAVAKANALAGKGVRTNAKSPKKKSKTSQAKSPASRQQKRSHTSAYGDSTNGSSVTQSPGFSPRKHRRRNGAVGVPTVTPRQVVRAKSDNGKSISQKLMEPLPDACWTLGENRSLPLGWRPPRAGPCDPRPYYVQPVEVNPMLQMTADEIVQHIQSVRREGRFTSFEKVSDILLKLMSDPRNRHGVFNTPVDPVALELPTYTTIVKHPMDLGTIKRNLAAGEYLELDDFVADVRLVFENAMLFNPETHYIHVDAQVLLNRFNEAVRTEQNRQCKRQRVQHACLVCRGNTCIVCSQQCLPVAQPHLQCSAGCSADIRKGSIYFITKDGTRVWCQKCKTRLARDRTNNSDQTADDTDAFLESLVKKKCEVGVEPWVKCDECDRWLHQVCGLYNPVVGAYQSHEVSDQEAGSVQASAGYVCPLCRCRRKRSTPPPESPMRKILHLDPDENAQNSSCLNIPSCELSIFIQDFLRRGLEKIGEHEAAQTLHVRALSFPGERMTVPEGVVNAFDENSQALSQTLPDVDTSRQRIPAHISYLSRGLYLFQKHEGMEVCLFTIYAQEFGDDCELEANRRAVYVAYLDSVRYLKPASARTAAYHLIMLAYFDYVRRHGFSRVHIWSCPPQKRISYVFWCRPPFQKTPSAEHLRRWYNSLLEKAKEHGIVKSWSTMYDEFFSDSVCQASSSGGSTPSASFVSVKEENGGVGVSTRGTTVQSLNPDELMWPVQQLPPIFDGDIIPSELERILGRIVSRNEKKERASKNKRMAVARAKNCKVARVGGKFAVGNMLMRIKEETPSAVDAVAPQVKVRLRELFNKLQFAVQRLKNDLLVVELEVDDGEEAKTDEGSGDVDMVMISRPSRRRDCRPEELVPSWCKQVPRFFGSRFMFHQLCSYAGYQFDSLRRAKHSTMMMLHHFFNESVVQLNVFCRECSLLITRAEFWSCRSCDRYALCDSCYRRLGKEHRHSLAFGTAPLPTSSTYQPERQAELPRLQYDPQRYATAPLQPPAPQQSVNICELS